MAERERVELRIRFQRLGDVLRRGHIPDGNEDSDQRRGRGRPYPGEQPGSGLHPAAAVGQPVAQQHSEDRVGGYRIVLLGRREAEEHEQEARPAGQQQQRSRRPSGAPAHGLNYPAGERTPWEQPHQVEQPEQQDGDAVVVLRPSGAEEAEQVLVEEVEPEEAAVVAGAAGHGEVEVRRVPDDGQDVPRRGDGERQQRSGDGTQAAPGFRARQLAGEGEVQAPCGHWEDGADQALEEQAGADGGIEQVHPESRPALFWIEGAQEAPASEGNGHRQEGVGELDPSEQPQPDTAGERQSRVETRPPAEGPGPEAESEPAQQHGHRRQGNARRPVVDAEDEEADGDHPVLQRRFLQVLDAVQLRGDPVARLDHVAGDLSLDGVHVVHKRGRADDAAEEDHHGDQQHDPFAGQSPPTVIPIASSGHRFQDHLCNTAGGAFL